MKNRGLVLLFGMFALSNTLIAASAQNFAPLNPYDAAVSADLRYACAEEIKQAETASPRTAWFRYAWAHQFKNFQPPGQFFDKIRKENRPRWIPFHYLYACASVTYMVQKSSGVGSGKQARAKWIELRNQFDQKYVAGKRSSYPTSSYRPDPTAATQNSTPTRPKTPTTQSTVPQHTGRGNLTRPTGLSQQQIAACTTDIHNKQRESQRWGGNVNDVSARLGSYQKQLFEGRCAGHPQAAAYLRGANKMLGARQERSTTRQSLVEQPATNHSSQSSSPSRASRNQASQPSAPKRQGRAYVGGHKQCIKFTPGNPPKPNSGSVHWYWYFNGCNITLKVCDNISGRSWGCGHEVKPGKTSRNWNSTANINRNGGNFFACAVSENGKTVHFDKETHTCYYNN